LRGDLGDVRDIVPVLPQTLDDGSIDTFIGDESHAA
jgi:hypothetical protein